MFNLLSNRIRKNLILPAVTLGAATIGGCGDPAPGEGMKSPMMKEPSPEVVEAQQAINSPDIPAIDPQTMENAEIEKVLGDAPRCAYRYTAESPPILAASNTDQGDGYRAVAKIHGRLVELSADRQPGYQHLTEGVTFTAEGMEMRLVAEGEEVESASPGERIAAELHFSLQQGLNVGYLGWYTCEPEQQRSQRDQ